MHPLFLSLCLSLVLSLSSSQILPLPFHTPTQFTCTHPNVTFAIPVPGNAGVFVIHFTNSSGADFSYNVSASTSPDLSGQVWPMIWDSNLVEDPYGWLGAEIWVNWDANATTIYLVTDCTIYLQGWAPVMYVEVVVPQRYPQTQIPFDRENLYGSFYLEDAYNHSNWFYFEGTPNEVSSQIYWAESCSHFGPYTGEIYIRTVSQMWVPFGDYQYQTIQNGVNANGEAKNAYQAVKGLNYWQSEPGSLRVAEAPGPFRMYVYIGTDEPQPLQTYYSAITNSYPATYSMFFLDFDARTLRVEDDLIIIFYTSMLAQVPDTNLLSLYSFPGSNFYPGNILQSACYVTKFGDLFPYALLNSTTDPELANIVGVKAPDFFKQENITYPSTYISLVYNNSLVLYASNQAERLAYLTIPAPPDMSYLYGVSVFAGILVIVVVILIIFQIRNWRRSKKRKQHNYSAIQ